MSSPDMKPAERIRGHGGPFRGPMAHGMAVEKPLDFKGSLKRLAGLLHPQLGKIVFLIAAGIVGVASATFGPKVLGRATNVIFAGVIGRNLPSGVTKAEFIEMARAQGNDRIADLVGGIDLIPGQGIDFSALRGVLLVVVGLYAVSSLLGFLQGFLLNDVVQATVFKMRSDVEDKLNRLPLRYFDRQPRGELLSRVTNDIDNLAQSLQQSMNQTLHAGLSVLMVTGMMFWISPALSLVALLTIPVTMVVAMLVMKRSQKHFTAQWRRTGDLNAHVEEAFTGHSLVKVFGRQKEVQSTFDSGNEELFRSSFSAQFLSGLIMPVMFFIGNLNYVVIAVLGGLRVAAGTLSLGDVQAFIQYTRHFTQPITQIASMINLLQSGVASAERVFELLDAESEASDEGLMKRPGVTVGRVEFDQVSFRYQPDQPLVENLSLKVEPGETVAIVGPTGAGKTTLVNLIMRFYELDSGRITLDGVDITTMTRDALRSRIGMVLQDTWLFRGTIRENIAYGRPNATPEEIVEAAEAALVDRFVRNLPDGYETVIDDEGSNVSAGEKQLITIARAFIAEPALLILDEATSSVDTRTELLVQHAMSALRSDRTSFVIAHRLSTIRDADLILMMEDGKIVERGGHDELMAAKGAYADLYNAQFSGPDMTEGLDGAVSSQSTPPPIPPTRPDGGL